jgi:hypothetical protein
MFIATFISHHLQSVFLASQIHFTLLFNFFKIQFNIVLPFTFGCSSVVVSILIIILFSNTLNLYSSLVSETNLYTHTEQELKTAACMGIEFFAGSKYWTGKYNQSLTWHELVYHSLYTDQAKCGTPKDSWFDSRQHGQGIVIVSRTSDQLEGPLNCLLSGYQGIIPQG